jgi:hypothetical protein
MGILRCALTQLKRLRGMGAASVIAAVLVTGLIVLAPPAHANAQTMLRADASCAQLASVDRTATNGTAWGTTLLRGHNAPGGWFGVDVCANEVNTLSPGGANLSCDRIPTDLAHTGCAPGKATSDGYGLSFQCVELVTRFAAWAFGDRPSGWLGDAPDLWLAGNHPRDFVAIPQGGTHAPVPGDILVWGTVDAQGHPWPGGPGDGHVAVVSAVHGSQLTFVEQNALAGGHNIPAETTTLKKVGSTWTVGSAAPVAAGARALYGWLHSTRNTGVWPAKSASTPTPTSAAATATPRSADSSRQLPSAAGAAVITSLGTLADLNWTTSPSLLPTSADDASVPYLAARSLGAPPQSALAPRQTPAVLLDPTGGRTIFALGIDGQVYAATTAPGLFGVLWQSLGSPSDRPLTGSAVAAAVPGGVAIAALDPNGAVWLRAGPLDELGPWSQLGAPSSASLTAIWLALAPASSSLVIVGLGADGQLYTSTQTTATPSDTNGSAAWSAWTDIPLPDPSMRLIGPLLGVVEPQPGQAHTGSAVTPKNAAIDLAAQDTLGHVVLARLTSGTAWQVRTLAPNTPLSSLVAVTLATTVTGQAGVTTLHVYAQGASGLTIGVVTVKAHATAAHWDTLSQAGVTGVFADTPSTSAIPFGDDQSLLVLPEGSSIALAGVPAALADAEPESAADQTATDPLGGAAAIPGLVSAGTVAGAQSFPDTFTGPVLAAEWVPVGGAPGGAAGQVSLAAPSGAGTTALLQKAPSGDATIETSVRLPQKPAAPMRAGLLLSLDAANWLTLAVAANSQVSLCAQAWGATPACHSVDMSSTLATNHSVALKLTRSGDTYTAAASADTQTWSNVGSWTVALPSGVSPYLTGTNNDLPAAQARANAARSGKQVSQAAAPLAFTSAGLFVEFGGASSGQTTATQPLFSFYNVVAASQP